jgi:hypothetical protein
MKRIYLSWPSDCNVEQSLPNIKKRIIGDCELIYKTREQSKDVELLCLLSLLGKCDSIFMLRGWEKDKKCLLEKIYAEYLGKEIYYEDNEVINSILSKVLYVFNISYDELVSTNRHSNYVYARVLFTIACRKKGYTLQTISKIIKRDHASLSHYIKLYNEDVALGAEYRNYRERFEAME